MPVSTASSVAGLGLLLAGAARRSSAPATGSSSGSAGAMSAKSSSKLSGSTSCSIRSRAADAEVVLALRADVQVLRDDLAVEHRLAAGAAHPQPVGHVPLLGRGHWGPRAFARSNGGNGTCRSLPLAAPAAGFGGPGRMPTQAPAKSTCCHDGRKVRARQASTRKHARRPSGCSTSSTHAALVSRAIFCTAWPIRSWPPDNSRPRAGGSGGGLCHCR